MKSPVYAARVFMALLEVQMIHDFASLTPSDLATARFKLARKRKQATIMYVQVRRS